MGLLFEKLDCQVTDSLVSSETKRDQEFFSVVTTNLLCMNNGLMDSPKQDINVTKNDSFGVSLLKVFQNGE